MEECWRVKNKDGARGKIGGKSFFEFLFREHNREISLQRCREKLGGLILSREKVSHSLEPDILCEGTEEEEEEGVSFLSYTRCQLRSKNKTCVCAHS